MSLTMQEFVTALRERRGWSVRRLASELHYSSATSIVRLCQESASADSAEKFARALRRMPCEPLDQAELAALDRVLERIHQGADMFHANQLLLTYLSADYRPEASGVTLVSPDGHLSATLLDRYRDAEELRIVLFNCEHVGALFNDLARLMAVNPVTVRHFIVADGPVYREVQRLMAITPVLYHERYACFSCDPLDGPMGMLEADAMTCSWRSNGQEHLDTILFLSPEQGMLFDALDSLARFDPPATMISGLGIFKPVRLEGMTSDDDFLAYCAYCADLERDRSIMRIKPDFGVEQIPVDTLSDALRDGLPDKELVERLLPSLRDIFDRRHHNAFTRRQPQYHVFTQQAVWHFMRTGRLSDHPYVLRPFTMAERAGIIRGLLTVLAENPFYHVFFFRRDVTPREDEMILYDGLALSLVKPHTDYHLGGGHSEVMISQQRFLKIYRSFFMNSILRYHTLPEEETVVFLGELLRYAADHPD